MAGVVWCESGRACYGVGTCRCRQSQFRCLSAQGVIVSREDVVAIASRLFALFLLVTSIRLGATLAAASDSFSSLWTFASFLAAIYVPIVAIAALLWFFPLTVARKLLPVMREPRPPVQPGSSTALELSLTAIGFWVLSTAITDAVYWSALLVQVHNALIPVQLEASQKASIAATIAELAIGAWCVFGSRGLTNLVTRIRYAGSPQSSGSAL